MERATAAALWRTVVDFRGGGGGVVMCVCDVCLCICLAVILNACAYIYIHTYVCACVCVCRCVYLSVYARARACVYVCAEACGGVGLGEDPHFRRSMPDDRMNLICFENEAAPRGQSDSARECTYTHGDAPKQKH